jgi:hypothetical protein
MKKISLLFIAILMSAVSFGQFHIGPQVGYSASNLSLNVDSISNSMKNNFIVGAFVRLGNKIYVQPEVNYMTQGSIFKWPSFSNPSPLKQEITIKTLQVPVNLGWKLIDAKVFNLRLMGGIVMNFNLNTDITTSGDNSNYDGLVPDDFKNMTWQWDAGAGVDILMFALDVKYVGGITNILDDIKYENGTVTSKSSMFVVTLGWKIF